MIIDGKRIAEDIQLEIKEKVDKIQTRPPCLAVILTGDNPASKIYVNRKSKACERVGILSKRLELPSSITEKELLLEIEKLNLNSAVDGILVQLPLPSHIDTSKIIHSISYEKDVDGFHPINVGKMLIGETDGFFPCTPYGILVLLQRYGIAVKGLKALIIGRSNIVGKPLASLLMQNSEFGNATVTVANSYTKNLKEHTLGADLIVAALGKPNFLTADMVKEGAVVIDVGINKIEDRSSAKGTKLVGDVDFENVQEKCSYITPVPGGVGPMTIAMLLKNTLKSFQMRTGALL